MRSIVFAVLLLYACSVHGSGFNYGSYRLSSLSDAANSFDINPRSRSMVDAGMKKYRIEVEFTGNVRSADPDFRQFIAGWAYALNVPSHVAELFDTEVEVRQGEEVLWMPIQRQMVDAFRREVAPTAKVEVFVLLLGAHEQDAVLAINEFHVVGK